PGRDQDAVAIGQGNGAACVGADVVAGDGVVRRASAGQEHALAGVAADEVPGSGGGSADGVAGSAQDHHAVAAVGQCGRGGSVGADLVALEHVPRGRADGYDVGRERRAVITFVALRIDGEIHSRADRDVHRHAVVESRRVIEGHVLNVNLGAIDEDVALDPI